MDHLEKALYGNASFSIASGAVLLFGAGALDSTLGLETWFLAAAGASLIGYGALLGWLAGRADVRPGARFATAMDVGWVLGAAVILVGFPTAMTPGGRVVLLIVSLVVAGFAVTQFRGLRVTDAVTA